MLGNLDHAVNKIAKHVDIVHPPELVAELVKAATFENMKSNAERFAPSAGQDFWKNDTGFFDSARQRTHKTRSRGVRMPV